MFANVFLKKEEIEEEDGDAIEKVLWHQRRGTAEEALRNNKSTDPVLLSYSFDTELDWNDMEFLIKWKGQSHLHCQWKSFSELQNVSSANINSQSQIISLLILEYKFYSVFGYRSTRD